MIGPSILPMPPMTTMKMMKTVQSMMLNEAWRRDAQLLQRDERARQCRATAPTPRKQSMRARVTLTPTDAALSSLSRIAVSPMPMRDRSSR